VLFIIMSAQLRSTVPSVAQPGFKSGGSTGGLVGGAQGVWGTEVPQQGPGAEPLVGRSGGGHSLPKAHNSY